MDWRNWKVWLGIACVGVGAYLAYRWYKGRRGLAGYGGLGGSPRWLGYGRARADFSTAKAFGAETAEIVDMGPQPNVAAGDVESAPEGVSFSDENDAEF